MLLYLDLLMIMPTSLRLLALIQSVRAIIPFAFSVAYPILTLPLGELLSLNKGLLFSLEFSGESC